MPQHLPAPRLLATQMFSLQTKFEKTIEEQLCEVERLITLRKEAQDAHEQAIQQVHALKHQLELQGQACASAQREAAAAVQQAAEREQQKQQAEAEAEMANVREELAAHAAELGQRRGECKELAEKLQVAQQRSQSADVRVLQLQAYAQQDDEAHRAAIKQVEDELHDQKAIYDSTVEEMLQLNNNYNELKQAYHKLKSESCNNNEMVRLVQQELAELSYYAAAGRAALGIAPASSLTSFRSSEISMGSVGGIPPAPAAAAGGECGGGIGESPLGARVTYAAALLTDGGLQLSEGRGIERKMSDDADPKMMAVVKAIRALSEDSTDGGLAAAGLEAAADLVAAAAADGQPRDATAKPGAAVLPVEAEEGAAAWAAAASDPSTPAALQQAEVAAETTATEAATAPAE
ncbi:hypothetical protein COO60DRAFT_1624947 [Scenedesmus sp. NREL 46B-D3]|nr:hypothetical protein COO60DRAFT_1624947 [Scenedesmus sp. NREL 46B-D3]